MTSANSSRTDDRFLSNAMASFIQIGALLLLLMLCFKIIAPFVSILIWAVVIAVGLYPTHTSFAAKLGGREKTSALILILIGLAIVTTPIWLTAESTIATVQQASANIEAGTVKIEPPAESVADWPLIGQPVYDFWSSAATNIESTLNTYAPQLKSFAQSAASFAGGMLLGALQFILSIIIAGALIMNAESSHRAARNIAGSLMGDEEGE
jgi:predicted PurR-regulated permease PerM